MKAPVIILNRTQMGENVGFAARSMKNFGFSELRLVNPGLMEENEWEAKENNDNFDLDKFLGRAVAVAKAGGDIIKNAKIYNNIAEASTDIERVYALTARRREVTKEIITPSSFVSEFESFDGKTALLFGGEASGLSNLDVSNAYKIIEIEVSRECPSINLGISVAIICHSLFSKTFEKEFKIGERGIEGLATAGEISYLTDFLNEKLKMAHYYKVPEKEEGMMINVKNIFSRNSLSKSEYKTLMGIFALIKTK